MQALIGKISPTAQYFNNSDPFNPTPVVANYMVAAATPYVLGTNSVTFTIYYGNCTFNSLNQVIGFTTIVRENVVVSGQLIDTWGVDDAVVLTELAILQGTTITEFIEGDINLPISTMQMPL